MASASFMLADYHCNAVEFSPFNSNILALVGGRNFGLSGGGVLVLLELGPGQDTLFEHERFLWKDVLFDVTCSEHSQHVFVTAGGDGSLQLWDLNNEKQLVALFKEHTEEVVSVEWNVDRREPCILSASWDHTIKLWNPSRSDSIRTFDVHNNNVYCVRWCPQRPSVFLSASGDGTICIIDILDNRSPCQKFLASAGEVLSCDWTKYDKDVFVTAGLDSQIRVWDLRHMLQPLSILMGHRYPVKRIKCSPHNPYLFGSVSYDFSTRFWDYRSCSCAQYSRQDHSEFSTGIDFNIHREGLVADCSWDRTVHMFSLQSCYS